MIVIKTAEELELMAKAASVTADMLRDLSEIIKPGISTKDIDAYVEAYTLKNHMIPAFKGYGGFPASACVSVNEEIVHGIPSAKKILREGDIVSVDLGTVYKEYYSDAARTYPVGRIDAEAQRLIRVTEESFFCGLEFCRTGYRLGDISHAIQKHAEEAGFSVIRDYVGHGIGRNLHEDPQIPNYGRPDRGPKLEPGMVLAIEPMIAAGDFEVDVLLDNWTAVTADGSLAAHYENTVVITQDEPCLLTCPKRDRPPTGIADTTGQRRNAVHV
ncbi:MAG: type I methionyl aminopeptidase [Bacillota bacterium]|jgi:methionyl aminopeptidase|nr:type I methionyl aminopeptidase [Eubacteriales bacterium]MDD4285642.1 type I methionyl aminopeptidase [Eubacteriales bacterium]MDI9491854.1 type I methionyl aminopeptidase [Bacillota bacterium]NLV70851.1 type I methionyl aminopeptidase [Clostridiales bacterium]